ncbi:DUF3560 domain-containing protein [Streptomyces sp. H10-C2]|uniref:DUF3560 domain-containing protein n=1 Tax=unclassified Streptomyces TaxID=2593676 RepID=UPI0024BACA29|nr:MULTISPECIES: DUF3560 domain-containing protein [unclassified Streptomyces]MDJ0345515.1 DUF3560 domain-containing protein [Streptomyces sp. PH10-H1]MDJ0374461.1 DUF3560 domain-containing protein [Streptomyces sp. H10-C2]
MTSTNALPMPVTEALALGAPRNLGALAATATARGWGAMVERDGGAWTLVIGSPSDPRTGRYTWAGGKWAGNAHGYRETVAFYQSDATGTPRLNAMGAPAVDVVPDPVADAEESAEAEAAEAAEAFRVKATRAHDRVTKGHKRVAAAVERAGTAWERAEAAQARASVAEAAESERAHVRVAEADALMWSHAPGTAEYRAAFGAFLAARFDAESLPAAEAAAEAAEYAEAARAASADEWETEEGETCTGANAARESADHAHAEVMIEYSTFERSTPAGRFDAETACGIICDHSRDMAAAVRHAEAAADAAEAAAEQAEAWADAAETEADAETDALFALGASADRRQVALARAHWGVSDVVAEAVTAAVETATEAAERRARMAAADVRTAAQRPAECEAAQRAAECAEAAGAAEEHSGRAAEAYTITHDLMTYTLSAWAARPVDLLPRAAAEEARALLRVLDRRSRAAHDVDFSARWERLDGSRVTDPQRSRDCANRARVLADACEADARRVAERFAWVEYAERFGAEAAERAEAPVDVAPGTAPVATGSHVEGGGRSRWVSADGRTVFTLALSSGAGTVAEADARFADVVAGAVAAKDAGRPLKSTDVPSKAKHGRGPGTEFKQAVVRASRALVQPWKAPRIPAEGKPLDGAALAVLDADGVCAEVETAPGVWLPRAAVCVAETAAANGWAVAMERHASGEVTVRVAGVLARTVGPVAGEVVAVWTDGMYDARRSGGYVGGRRMEGAAELSRVLATVGQDAEAGEIVTGGAPTGASAPAPAGVSDPGAVEAWEGDGGAVPGIEVPRPAALPVECAEDRSAEASAPAGEGGNSGRLDACASSEARAVRQARRRAEEAAGRAAEARRRAEALHDGASAHYGRFAGGQPILRGHHSERGALRDRARGDAATRRAIEATEEANRAESAARKARQAVELAEIVHGRSRPWERADFQRGDVVEVRKIYTASYVVVRANGKTLTLRNMHTIDDIKARYDQVLSRTRGGRTVADPGQDDAPSVNEPAQPGGVDEVTSVERDVSGGEGGISQKLDAYASIKWAPDVINDPGAVGTWDADGGAVPDVQTPAAVPPAAGLAEEAEDVTPLDGAAGHLALVECQAAADLLIAYAEERPHDEEAEEWAFTAVERVAMCAWGLEEGDEEGAAEYAREARGERAAVTLGRLDEAGPMTPERLAALDADTLALLQWYGGPWPVRWLWPPEEDAPPRVVQLFHGPGGWSVGIRDVLGADVDMVGVDLDPGAVATAEAAGFEMIRASVTDLDPECPALQWVTGIVLSPPCQAFSPAGLRMGRYASAIELIAGVIRGVGAAAGFLALVDAEGQDAGTAPRSGETWEDVRAPLAELADERAGLMAEVVVWPLAMLARGGSVEWVAVEQSSALPSEIERALMDEFVQAGWGTVEAETLDAVDYGAASHRRRRFLTAHRTGTPFVSARPAAPFPVATFAECAGWERGRMVNTRGVRGLDPRTGRPKGGNEFSADKPAGCITATAYGWKDGESGEKIAQATIGRLVGFPGDYPWRHVGRGAGIRNRAQQAADAVCPMVAAAIIGRVLDIIGWERRARAYADALYGRTARPDVPCTLPRVRSAVPLAGVLAAASAAGPVPALAASAPAGTPVLRHLLRRALTGGSEGLRAGHSARQGAMRQATQQATQQQKGEAGRRLSTARGRGPPPSPGLGSGGGASCKTCQERVNST